MSVLDDWLAAVAAELGVPDPVDTRLLLDVTRDVAHGVVRPAAPLTTYLLGLAVARGADPGMAAARVAALAAAWPTPEATPPTPATPTPPATPPTPATSQA